MAAGEPMVLAAWTSTLLRALNARGLCGDALAREAGITPEALADPEARVPLTATTALWRLAVQVTGDPCFGIEVSRHVRPGSFQSLGLGVVSSRTLADALERSIRFGDVVLTGKRRNTLTRHDEVYQLVLGVLEAPIQPAMEAMEAILASIVRVTRFLVRSDVAPLEVRLVRPAAPPSRRFERFFGCPVTYGAEEYALTFDRALVEQPLPAACDRLAQAADRLALEYVERLRSSGAFADEVRGVVASQLASGVTTTSAVARALATSERTLQRRLRDEGTTLRDVVCDARIDLAKQMLIAERVGSHELARRLGFSEAAAFRRAFKRSTGLTPRDFVAELRGPLGGVPA